MDQDRDRDRDRGPPGSTDGLYGNWYYQYGAVCGHTDTDIKPPFYGKCPVKLNDYLKVVPGAKENTAFYMGTGAYISPDTKQYGWWCVEKN